MMANPFNEPSSKMFGKYILETWDGFEWQTFVIKDTWVDARTVFFEHETSIIVGKSRYKAMRIIQVTDLAIRGA
jgi:hypothetical protein